METGAAQLSTFVDKVLASTNTTKVNFVGHSQGSLMPRYYLKFLGGATKVNKFAGFGTIVYGTDLNGLVPFLTGVGLHDLIEKIIDPVCKSCFQFLMGSDFLNKLNAGGDTVPGVQYKFIISKLDKMITPLHQWQTQGPEPPATNVVLQDICVGDLSEHIDQMLDPVVFHSINAFIDSNAPQDVNCWLASWN